MGPHGPPWGQQQADLSFPLNPGTNVFGLPPMLQEARKISMTAVHQERPATITDTVQDQPGGSQGAAVKLTNLPVSLGRTR